MAVSASAPSGGRRRVHIFRSKAFLMAVPLCWS